MMWEYKIYKTNMGWSIYRKEEEGKLIKLQYLNGYDMRTTNKTMAKTFYTEDSAVGALVIMRSKKGKTDTTSIEKSGCEERREKTSWSELSS